LLLKNLIVFNSDNNKIKQEKKKEKQQQQQTKMVATELILGMEELVNHIRELEVKNKKLEEELSATNTALEMVKDENEVNKKNMMKFMKENKQLKKEISHLEDRAVADYDTRMKERKKLEEENKKLKSEYQPKGSRIDPEGLHDYMKEEIEKLKKEISELKGTIDALEDDLEECNEYRNEYGEFYEPDEFDRLYEENRDLKCMRDVICEELYMCERDKRFKVCWQDLVDWTDYNEHKARIEKKFDEKDRIKTD